MAFRREKFIPFGGPAGGDGGNGGSVLLVADPGLGTLVDLRHQRVVRAEDGTPGKGKDQYGRAGRDQVVRVPLGTVIADDTTKHVLAELLETNQRVVVARGGAGGRGNRHFASSTDRAPRRFERGRDGEHRRLRLTLKVMADVGLLGFPNVGKSTFIRAVSRATPKVADYPFTTLTPHLGVARLGDWASGLGTSIVLADIPGLIPGAASGAGLGTQFLKHLERTRLLLHLLSLSAEPERSPLADYHALRKELLAFDPALAARPEIVAMSKADLPEVVAAHEALAPEFEALGIRLHLVSAATGRGLEELMRHVASFF